MAEDDRIRISFAVMAHQKRAHFIPYLLSKLGADTPVVWDRRNDVWDTARRAWLARDPRADFHCVVQDDMIIGRGFVDRAADVCTKEAVFNFYLSKRQKFRKHVDRAKRQKLRFLVFDHLYHEACFALPAAHVEPMVAYCDARGAVNCRLINAYIRSVPLKVYFPMPSLVSHRPEPSLHPFNRGRYPAGARYFIGE